MKLLLRLALLISLAVAQLSPLNQCFNIKLFECTDSNCLETSCTANDAESPAAIENKCVNRARATCTDSAFVRQTYATNDCTGAPASVKRFAYDQCVQDPVSQKYIIIKAMIPPPSPPPPSGGPEYWQLSPWEYERRFKQRWDINAPYNVLGYGAGRRFVPPLLNPTWLLSELDRGALLLASSPASFLFTEGFVRGLGNGEAWDLFWYNNAAAAGSQLYPTGLSKYFDLNSAPGFARYLFFWGWTWFSTLLSPFTFGVPLTIWMNFLFFQGNSFQGIWKILIPPALSWFLHVQGERGWPLY